MSKHRTETEEERITRLANELLDSPAGKRIWDKARRKVKRKLKARAARKARRKAKAKR